MLRDAAYELLRYFTRNYTLKACNDALEHRKDASARKVTQRRIVKDETSHDK